MEQQLGMIAVKKTKLLGALSEFDHSDHKVEADLEFILRHPQVKIKTASVPTLQQQQQQQQQQENGFSRDQVNRAPIKRAHKYSTTTTQQQQQQQQYHPGMRLTTKSTNL